MLRSSAVRATVNPTLRTALLAGLAVGSLQSSALANVFDDALQCAVDVGSVVVIPLVQVSAAEECRVRVRSPRPCRCASSPAEPSTAAPAARRIRRPLS